MKRRSLLLAWPAVAWSEPLRDLQQRLQTAPLQRGRFEQDKNLAGFAKPLKSRGDYLLVRGKGLIWRTQAPFASQLVMTREAIAGSDGLRLEAAKEPGIRLVTGLMLALLDGDLQALHPHFTTAIELRSADAWRAKLIPKAASLARLFNDIELEGDRQVRRIGLSEAQGDRTLIQFDEQIRAPSPPSPEEVRLLA